MNVILAACSIAAACAAAAVWYDVRAALWVASILRARGLALKASREAYRTAYKSALGKAVDAA